jgi:conjugal transfer pilus assembly protein TraF
MVIFKCIFVLVLFTSVSVAEIDILFPKNSKTPSSWVTKSWYVSPERGWLWYKRSPLPKKREDKYAKDQKDQSESPIAPLKESHPYSAQMEKVRKTFEEIQNKAILEPTLENVQTMQNAQNIIMNRATAFEKSWMLASLLNAGNFRESDQPSPSTRKIYLEKQERELDQQIQLLSKTYGLFIIFKNDCPYCHEFAPIVKQLARTYGFEVKAISEDGNHQDGGLLELFPDAVLDNGTIAKINPEGIFPCLFLINPHSREVIPLVRGLLNLSELRENFAVIIQSLPRKSLSGKPFGEKHAE